MNKQKEALVIVIAIITFALISASIGNLTGQASTDIGKRENLKEVLSKESIISVSPKTISNGERITITVYPGPDGVDKMLEIWADKSARKETIDFGRMVNEGAKNRCIVKCRNTVSKDVLIRSYQPGLYYVKAKGVEYAVDGDRTNTVAKGYFRVE